MAQATIDIKIDPEAEQFLQRLDEYSKRLQKFQEYFSESPKERKDKTMFDPIEICSDRLNKALSALYFAQPHGGETAALYDVVINDVRKAIAFFEYWIADNERINNGKAE